METPLKTGIDSKLIHAMPMHRASASRASVITLLQKKYNRGKDGLSVG
jgi:hypothetical protein